MDLLSGTRKKKRLRALSHKSHPRRLLPGMRVYACNAKHACYPTIFFPADLRWRICITTDDQISHLQLNFINLQSISLALLHSTAPDLDRSFVLRRRRVHKWFHGGIVVESEQ